MAEEGILLESGTNEVEIMEILLGDQSFGVNVLKVQAVLLYEPNLLTQLPESDPAVLGMYLYRGEPIPLIDLATAFHRPHLEKVERPIVLVTEFNLLTNAFLIDGVNRIHRVSWNDLQPLGNVLTEQSARFTGSITIEGREILLIDLERLIAELFPETAIEARGQRLLGKEKKADRDNIQIILAEDSSTIRMMIRKVLADGGYTHITEFHNGKDALQYWTSLAEKAEREHQPLEEDRYALISDIEMPQMDGLTLCRRLREQLGLKKVTVIMFSSLINEQTALKCEDVGANACISKPEIEKLVSLLDDFCLSRSSNPPP